MKKAGALMLKNWKQILLFFVAFLLYNLLVLYLGWNGYHWLKSLKLVNSPFLYLLFVFLLAYAYILSHFIRSSTFLKIIGSYWLAIFEYGLLLFPIANLSWLLLQVFIPADDVTRFIGSITFGILLFLIIYGSFNAYSPVVRNYPIVLDKKQGKRASIRIAMASDMHFGTLSGKRHLNRLIREVNKLQPDLILLVGDIIDDDPLPFLKKKMGDQLKELDAPLGVYGVLGNHEYYGKMIPTFLEEMKRIGVHMLLDEAVTVDQTIRIIGRKDKTDDTRLSIADLLASDDHQLPLLMMDHQPTALNEGMKAGIDLLLCGHTHRGQLAPNHLITKKVFELDYGYKKKNQLHTIVSSGFGFWGPPIRIGSRSEIVSIDINFK